MSRVFAPGGSRSATSAAKPPREQRGSDERSSRAGRKQQVVLERRPRSSATLDFSSAPPPPRSIRRSPRSKQSSIAASIDSSGAFTARQASSNPPSHYETSPPAASHTSGADHLVLDLDQPEPKPTLAGELARDVGQHLPRRPAVSAPEPPRALPAGVVERGERLQPAREVLLSLGQPEPPALLGEPLCADAAACWRKERALRRRTIPRTCARPARAPAAASNVPGAERAAGGRARSRAGGGATAEPSRIPCELDDGRARMRRGQSGGRELDRLALCPGRGQRLDAQRGIGREQPVAPSFDEEGRDAETVSPVQDGDHAQLGAWRRRVPPPGERPGRARERTAQLVRQRVPSGADGLHPGEVDDQLSAAQAYNPASARRPGSSARRSRAPAGSRSKAIGAASFPTIVLTTSA